MKTANKPQENQFLNLVINIFLPVIILNKGAKFMDPRWTLVIALMLPLGYGIQDYVRRKHKNYVSLLGLVNIALTGGLALMSLNGIWFAVKEASLPFLLGILVLGSTWTKNPAVKMMFCNPQVLDMDLIYERIKTFMREKQFNDLLKKTTIWLSLSFFISAVLNFVLAYDIFRDIDQTLEQNMRDQILNEQIAQMTWMGFVVIALPLMIFSSVLIYMFLRSVSKLTEVPINSLLKT